MQLDLNSHCEQEAPGESHIRDWEHSAPALAARGYRRESRWDHSPGEAGIWLLCVMPYESMGASWIGRLVAFAIIHDRDMDGEYESLAHLWTACSCRRRGLGGWLMREAQARFPLNEVGPRVTDDGRR